MAIKNLRNQFIERVNSANKTAIEAQIIIDASKAEKKKAVEDLKKDILQRAKDKRQISFLLSLSITSRQTVLDYLISEMFNEEKSFFCEAKMLLHKKVFLDLFRDVAEMKESLSELNYLIDNAVVFNVMFEDDYYCITVVPSIPVVQEVNY